MAFDTIKYRFQEISERLEDYVDSTVEYYKLKLLKVLAKITISIISLFVYGSLFLFVLLFLAIGAAFWLGTLLESVFSGFLLIGGFFGLILICMFIFGRRLIEKKILSNFSDFFYDDEESISKEKEVERELDELELLIREEAKRRRKRR